MADARPVVHFEVIGKDGERLRSYYSELFGWEINADNPMNYGIVNQDDNPAPEGSNSIGISLSYGNQQSTRESTLDALSHQGSSLSAGNGLNIIAREGDIVVAGSTLTAGGDLGLAAGRDILLSATEEMQQTRSTNSSSGVTTGVGIGVGESGWGITFSASGNISKGHENSDSLSYSESRITAGDQVTLISGRDATLAGAQVSGASVTADIGRNLSLISTQDTERYDSKQQSAGAGGTFTYGSMSASGGMSLSRDTMTSDYASVAEQTGIFAGAGGVDLTVGGHTQLDGAVIASTAAAALNRLETTTLGFSDITNHADFEVEHQSFGLSSGGSIGGGFAGNMANGLPVGINNDGRAASTTYAAISDGSLIIRDTESQQQDVRDLRRDTAQAGGSLDPIFDKEREQRRIEEAQLISGIGNQVADIARTQGDINGLSEAKKTHPDMSADELRKTDAYKTEIAKYGTGSAIQQGLSAATAAIQGLAGGDLKAALAGGAAPYLAEVIKQVAPDESSRVMAHAVVAGALAAVQGNSAAAGAAGAATTALMGEVIKNALYGDTPVNELSERQKQTLVALGTAAAGLAGGLTGGSSGDAVTGAQAGQNEISNNMVGAGLISQMLAQETLNAAAIAESGKGNANDAAALALTKKVKEGLDAACLANPSCLLMAVVAAQNQPKAPSNTGGEQIAEQSPTNTGGNQQVDPNITHTGNNQPSEQGAMNTGNTDNAPDAGGSTTTTPVAEQNPDDLAYLAGGYEPNKGAVGNMGEFLNQPGFGSEIESSTQKTGQQYQGQSVYQSTDNIGDYIKKGDQLYLDGQHKDHIEVFDKRGNFRAVLNLDGSINEAKTKAAEGRKFK